MTKLYFAYRKRDLEGKFLEISILASSQNIEKDQKYATDIPLKLESNLEPETAISQIKSSIFGNNVGARGLDDKDKLKMLDSIRLNELRLNAPKYLENTIFELFCEYVRIRIRDRYHDRLSERWINDPRLFFSRSGEFKT